MSILLQAADLGSFTAAAKALRIPLPTVSRRIAELEAHLGARLLHRTTRKLSLTEAGETYVAAARRILEQVDDAERSAAGEYRAPRGELILTAPVMFGRLHVLPLVAEFLALYPDIDVQLLLSDRNLHLVDDHVDMAVRIGDLPDSRLIATRIGLMRTVICAAPKLLTQYGEPSSPADLTRLPCVNFDPHSRDPAWRLRPRRAATAVETPVRARLSVTTAEAAVWAAEQGVGATQVLHYQVQASVAGGAMRLILEPFEPDPSPIHLLHVPHGELPLKLRTFLDFAAPRLRQDVAAL